MLTIDKKREEVCLLVRYQERIWSPAFIFSFCLALFLHFLAFCLFHVHPVQPKRKEILLSAVTVNTAIAALAELEQTPINYFEPKLGIPSIPLIEPSLSPLFEDFPHPHLDLPEAKHPRIRISGPLAHLAYINLDSADIKNLNEIYEVRVDNCTGCIIWYRSLRGEPNASAESFLERIRFAGDKVAGWTLGWIELEGK